MKEWRRVAYSLPWRYRVPNQQYPGMVLASAARLIDLAADDLMVRDEIPQKMNELKHERPRLEAGLTSANEQLSSAQVLRDALPLVEDPQRLTVTRPTMSDATSTAPSTSASTSMPLLSPMPT